MSTYTMKASCLTLIAMILTCGASFGGTLAEIPFKDMEGKELSLKKYSGKVILVVNTASKCGLTKQYTALEDLQKKYESKGFTVLAFPCNDFMGQEPGTNEEIKTFCSTKYGVTFPVFDKLHVKGKEQHPLYVALSGPGSKYPGDVKWNFGKFLIGKNGEVLARFEPKTTPDDPQVIEAIEAALK